MVCHLKEWATKLLQYGKKIIIIKKVELESEIFLGRKNKWVVESKGKVHLFIVLIRGKCI